MAAAIVPVRIRRGIVHIERERTANGRRIVRAGTRNEGRDKAAKSPSITLYFIFSLFSHRWRDTPPPLRGSPSQKVIGKKGRSQRSSS